MTKLKRLLYKKHKLSPPNFNNKNGIEVNYHIGSNSLLFYKDEGIMGTWIRIYWHGGTVSVSYVIEGKKMERDDYYRQIIAPKILTREINRIINEN